MNCPECGHELPPGWCGHDPKAEAAAWNTALERGRMLDEAEAEIARLRRIEKAARPAERVLESCRSAGLLNEEETAVLNALYVALRAALEADHD